MESHLIIIVVSAIILVAYAIEQMGKRMRIPSVIPLLAFGILLQKAAEWLNFELPFVSVALPTLGTVGLILIVLEGALDLELSKKKKKIILLTLFSSVIGSILSAVSLAFLIQWFTGVQFTTALINAVPLSVISSAVAIPSVQPLTKHQREYVIYESSFSDIIGVLFFSVITSQRGINSAAIAEFSGMFVLTCISAVFISLFLVWYLDKVEHHVKFLPIFSALLLLYGAAKHFHSSPLIIALIFGLALNNTPLFIRGKLTRFFRNRTLMDDLGHFRKISAEAVFLIKALFFILFGFSIYLQGLFNIENIKLALLSFGVIVLIRFLVTRVLPQGYNAVVYFAPRGLITLLLFLSIPGKERIDGMNEGVVTLIVLLSILFMLPGSWQKRKAEQ
ncbi:MAG: hypothetical protein IT223_00500 [Crocinitomicaceae bacterium]|nr:hypothetical protein [Crocinitomicaceae bacterium]